MIKHVDRRLDLNYEEAEKHSDGHKKEAAANAGKLAADGEAGGKEAYVCAGKEYRKADEGVNYTDGNSDHLALRKSAGNKLEKHGEDDDGQERNCNLLGIIDEAVKIYLETLLCIFNRVDALNKALGVVGKTVDLHNDAEGEHRDYRTDAAKCGDTEGVCTALFISSCRGNTGTERHYEGYGHRTRGNSARVKCKGAEAFGQEEGQGECRYVEHHENNAQIYTQNYTQKRNYKEESDSDGDGKYQ